MINKNSPITFFSIKGRGDLLILINFINFYKTENHKIKIYTLKKYKDIIRLYLKKRINIIYLEDDFAKLFQTQFSKLVFYFDYLRILFRIKKLINRELNDSFIFVDLPFSPNHFFKFLKDYLKNFLIFGFIPKQYTTNIYELYGKISKEFHASIEATYGYKFNSKKDSVLIFFNSTDNKRCIAKNDLDQITSTLHSLNIRYSFAKYRESSLDMNSYPHTSNSAYFTNDYELFWLINKFSFIISIDSYPLHVAILLNKSIFVLSDSWKCFLPKSLSLKFTYKTNDLNKLLGFFKSQL